MSSGGNSSVVHKVHRAHWRSHGTSNYASIIAGIRAHHRRNLFSINAVIQFMAVATPCQCSDRDSPDRSHDHIECGYDHMEGAIPSQWPPLLELITDAITPRSSPPFVSTTSSRNFVTCSYDHTHCNLSSIAVALQSIIDRSCNRGPWCRCRHRSASHYQRIRKQSGKFVERSRDPTY